MDTNYNPAAGVAEKLAYRIPEAVAATGIGRSRLYELMRSGEIRSVTLGRTRLIPAEDLRDFVARLRTQGGDAA